MSIGIDSNFFSSFFTSASSTSKTDSTSTFLSDYASIRNGSYKKLLSAYYQLGNSSSTSSSTETTSTVTEKTAANKLVTGRSAASDLKNSAQALMDSKLYEKTKKVTDEETGEVTYDYDRSKIDTAVKKFVSDYNSVIEDVGKQDSFSLLNKGVVLTSTTKANANLLSGIGITVGSDNKLVIDEEKFKNASVTDIKSALGDKFSYGSSVERTASAIYYSSDSQLSGYINKYGSSGVNFNYRI